MLQLILPYRARQDFRNVIVSVNSKESICLIFFSVLKFEMHTLNKMKWSKLGIPYCGKKSNDSIVHYNDATYSNLNAPIVCSITNILICE